MSLEVAAVRALRADEGGARTSAVAAAQKRLNDGTRQTTLQVVKRQGAQTPPHANSTAAS